VNADNAVNLPKLGVFSPKHVTMANLFSGVEGVSFDGNTLGQRELLEP